MGGAHIRTGKYFFLCIAILIVSSLLGCATLREMEVRYEAGRSLSNAEKMLAEGNYDDAAKENLSVLSMVGDKMPADRALFNLGLIYAHNEYPGKDYATSRGYFARLYKEFPESQLADQARLWVSVFDVIRLADEDAVKKDAVISDHDETISDLRHLLASQKFVAGRDFEKALKENDDVLSREGKSALGDEALFNLGLIYSHQDNPNKDFKKSAGFFKRIIEEYPQSPLIEQAGIWLGVLNVIEKSKQVDIEIEKKKKELVR